MRVCGSCIHYKKREQESESILRWERSSSERGDCHYPLPPQCSEFSVEEGGAFTFADTNADDCKCYCESCAYVHSCFHVWQPLDKEIG
jgi:hypothetical protein